MEYKLFADEVLEEDDDVTEDELEDVESDEDDEDSDDSDEDDIENID